MWLAGTGVRARLVRFLEQPFDQLDAVGDGLPRAAGLLDVEGMQLRPGREALLLEHAVDLVGLAAEADHHHRGEVRVARIAAEGAAQHLQRLAVAGGGAAGAVRQRDHAVDVREARERGWIGVAAEVVGDRPRHRRRAVDRGQDADVVARRDPAVGADDAVEGRALDGVVGRLGAARRRVVARESRELEVVRVDVLPRRDRLLGAADDLVVAAHRIAGGGSPGSRSCGREGSGPTTVMPSLSMRVPPTSWWRAMTTSSLGWMRMTSALPSARTDALGQGAHGVIVRRSLVDQLGSQAWTFCRCSPRPAMPSRISSPAFRYTGVGFMPMATPGGVPVVIRSPGQSVMKRLT